MSLLCLEMQVSKISTCNLLSFSTNVGNGLNRCELVFENCFVPEENVLGQEGKGILVPYYFYSLMHLVNSYVNILSQ